MKKIVMLNCLRANSVCTGAACLQAFNAKTKTFARYGDEPLELVAFRHSENCPNFFLVLKTTGLKNQPNCF